jgi:antitoxin HicB
MKKNVKYYKNLPYTIEITPDDEVFFIKIKELPGCISQGDTIQEALDMIDDAMNCWLEAALEDVNTIPLPESMRECSFSGKISLRMPKSLHKKVYSEAKKEGVSINSYIVTCLTEQNTINLIANKMDELNKQSLVFYTGIANETWRREKSEAPKKTLSFDQSFFILPKDKYTKLNEIKL